MANKISSFGKKISKDEAQRLYKNFVKIKKRAIQKIRTALSEDNESARFHSGLIDSNGNCCFLDNMFVFDKVTLSGLLSIDPSSIKIDGVTVFFGSRDMEDSPDPNNPSTYIDVDGRPTLLIFPFNYENDPKTNLSSNNIIINLDEAYEHPGTGGGPGGGGDGLSNLISINNANPPLPILGELPTSVPIGNIVQLETKNQ